MPHSAIVWGKKIYQRRFSNSKWIILYKNGHCSCGRWNWKKITAALRATGWVESELQGMMIICTGNEWLLGYLISENIWVLLSSIWLYILYLYSIQLFFSGIEPKVDCKSSHSGAGREANLLSYGKKTAVVQSKACCLRKRCVLLCAGFHESL